jgi:hypothetical protein
LGPRVVLTRSAGNETRKKRGSRIGGMRKKTKVRRWNPNRGEEGQEKEERGTSLFYSENWASTTKKKEEYNK